MVSGSIHGSNHIKILGCLNWMSLQTRRNERKMIIYTIKIPERVSVTLLREPSSGHVSYFELGKAY
jgi:hypothetical protein